MLFIAQASGLCKSKKALLPSGEEGLKKNRQRPTLPPRLQGSTIGAGGLNFCVRDGNRCFPSAIATEKKGKMTLLHLQREIENKDYGQAARPISTSKLSPLLDLHRWPINLVVYKGSSVPASPPKRDI